MTVSLIKIVIFTYFPKLAFLLLKQMNFMLEKINKLLLLGIFKVVLSNFSFAFNLKMLIRFFD